MMEMERMVMAVLLNEKLKKGLLEGQLRIHEKQYEEIS